MSRSFKAAVKARYQTKLGEKFNLDTFNKAWAKAQRWARNAYGSADMQEYQNESGEDFLDAYYEETEVKPHGFGTYNRETAVVIRRNKGGA